MYTVSQKNKTRFFCPYFCQMPTDFYTDRHDRKLAIVFIEQLISPYVRSYNIL